MPAAEIDLNELLRSSQGLTLDMAGKQFALTANRQSIIADRKFDETDLVQAAAAKELGKMGENPRYQPQTPPGATSTG